MNLPTEQQCLELFQQYKVPQNVRRHCLMVRRVAMFLAKKLKESGLDINMELVNCAALLHDLFKMVSVKEIKPTRFHNYTFSQEEIAMWEHLREKYRGMYEGEVAYLLLKKNYPELALTIKKVSNPEEKKTWEELIVHYADWRTFQNDIVTLQERLDYLKEAYPREAGAWKEDEQRITSFEQKIMNKINLTPEKLAGEVEKHD